MGLTASHQVIDAVTCLLRIIVSSRWMMDVKVMEPEAITVDS